MSDNNFKDKKWYKIIRSNGLCLHEKGNVKYLSGRNYYCYFAKGALNLLDWAGTLSSKSNRTSKIRNSEYISFVQIYPTEMPRGQHPDCYPCEYIGNVTIGEEVKVGDLIKMAFDEAIYESRPWYTSKIDLSWLSVIKKDMFEQVRSKKSYEDKIILMFSKNAIVQSPDIFDQIDGCFFGTEYEKTDKDKFIKDHSVNFSQPGFCYRCEKTCFVRADYDYDFKSDVGCYKPCARNDTLGYGSEHIVKSQEEIDALKLAWEMAQNCNGECGR